MAIHIHSFTFNAFQENTFVLSDEDKNCIIIDPGCYERQEQNELADYIQSNDLKPLALLNTHGHIDHVLGNEWVKRTYNVDHYIHIDDLMTMRSVESYAHVYGFEKYEPASEPSHILQGGEQLKFGSIELACLFTPGHSPGHVVFYNSANGFVVNGDVLFSGSFGRVDLPGGDLDTLKQSIFGIMFQLPDATVVYCGHGPSTTIGQEKQTNYILQF
jgi:glyoxylase-like metal-dependent hydrolase (beta-lactamase superfamily II)